MAESVGLFSRLSNLWRGFISLWIKDVEQKHPEIAYENAINSMVAKYSDLKGATARIIGRREEIGNRLETEQAELAQIEGDLNTAVETGQDDLAMLLIQKQEALQTSIAGLTEDLLKAKNDADEAKAALGNVKGEIQKLKEEKDRMLAKMSSAQARVKIQEQIEGLSLDAEDKALNNVRESIKETIAKADLNTELADNDLDNRLAKLRQSTGSVSAKAKLEEMKRKRQAAAAAQTDTNKTM